jgi:hypothetical protein
MKTFPHIFDPSYGNTVDIFMLTSYHGDQDKKRRITDYLTRLFGERLKVLAFLDDLYDCSLSSPPREGSSHSDFGHENIGGNSGHENNLKQNEEQIMEKWNELSSDKVLSYEEWNNYRNELSQGVDHLFLLSQTQSPRFFYYHWKHLMELSNISHPDHRKIHLAKDKFVPRLYYRKWLVNSLRQKYEAKLGVQGHGYDWVVLGRPFDMIYEMRKPLDFLCLPAQPGKVYASIDHFIATTPENMDTILAPFETKYPVVGYEQWLDERFCAVYRSFDQYLYYLRNDTTYCSENQILWQCVKGEGFVNLRISNNSTDTHIVVNPDAFLHSVYCPERQRF